MSTADLDTFLLQNWADLDAAAARAGRIESEVYEAFADDVGRWASQRGWSGVFTEDDIWLSPPEWTLKPGPRPSADAFFALDYFGPNDNFFSLSTLMGFGQDVVGFTFRQTRMSVKNWRPIATSPELLSALPGFTLQSTELVLPLRLDRADVLEAASAGAYGQVARLIIPVLDGLEVAAAVIDHHLAARP